MWIPPKDKGPTVLQYPARIGEFQGIMSDIFNATIFLRFLTVLMNRGKGKRMQIILDNARYHHARLIVP